MGDGLGSCGWHGGFQWKAIRAVCQKSGITHALAFPVIGAIVVLLPYPPGIVSVDTHGEGGGGRLPGRPDMTLAGVGPQGRSLLIGVDVVRGPTMPKRARNDWGCPVRMAAYVVVLVSTFLT